MFAHSRQEHRRNTDRRGVALVELAVCLPLILLLVIATIEACSMIYLKQSLTVAAYEGARTMIVPGATSNDVISQCQQVLQDRSIQGAQVTLNPSDIQSSAIGTYLRVEIDAPCDANRVVASWFFGGKTITGSAEYMKEF